MTRIQFGILMAVNILFVVIVFGHYLTETVRIVNHTDVKYRTIYESVKDVYIPKEVDKYITRTQNVCTVATEMTEAQTSCQAGNSQKNMTSFHLDTNGTPDFQCN